MNLIADTHTHTIACDHAYSTLTENAAAAAKRGLRFLASTEHASALPGAPRPLHFSNLKELPPQLHGVTILKGAEVNILDREGNLDLPEWILARLDWVIASFHVVTCEPMSEEDHTRAWLAVAENPHVDVIGHCGDGRFPFDHSAVIKAFAKQDKIVEINAHSFKVRPGSAENCPRIARLCAREGVRVVVSSDAHFHDAVGRVDRALTMLAEIDFPRELILNMDYERFLAVTCEKAGPDTRPFLNEVANGQMERA